MTESQLLDGGPHIEDLGPPQIDKNHTMQPLKTMSQKKPKNKKNPNPTKTSTKTKNTEKNHVSCRIPFT